MDQIAKRTIVVAEAVCRIEVRGARGAQAAEAMLVQGARVQEGRAAAEAEVLGTGDLRGVEAGLTDGNAGEAGEGGAADSAVVGKEKRKKALARLTQPVG